MDVEAQACGGLVDAIEDGDMDLAEALVRAHVDALRRKMPRPDAAILGCTHYPLVADAFQAALGEDVTVFSQADLVADSLPTICPASGLRRGRRGADGDDGGSGHRVGPGHAIPAPVRDVRGSDAMRGLKKTRRIQVIAIAAVLLAGSTALVGYAMRDGINFFRSPSQVAEAPPLPTEVFRIGGLVEADSLVRGQGTEVAFRVTDGGASIPVRFEGVLPDLFGEGEGMVGTGRYVDGTFRATEILARHDETYMPAEVIDALKEQGGLSGPAGLNARPTREAADLRCAGIATRSVNADGKPLTAPAELLSPLQTGLLTFRRDPVPWQSVRDHRRRNRRPRGRLCERPRRSGRGRPSSA